MSAGIRTYLELMRYGNCLMAGFAAVIGTLIAFNILMSGPVSSSFARSFPFLDAGLVFLVVFMVSGAGNAINDYFDIKIDSINRPERPIPSGRVKAKEALYFSYLLFTLGTLLFLPQFLVGECLLLLYYLLPCPQYPLLSPGL